MTWSLVTAPDERERCCVVVDGKRCELRAELEVRGAGGEPDDYTFTCVGHLRMIAEPGALVRPAAALFGRVIEHG